MTGRKPKSKKKCYVCGDPVEGLGLCNRHYHRLKKYGSPYILKNRPDGTGTIDDGYVSIMKNKQRKKEHVHKECRLKYSREYARTRAMGGAANG